MDTTDALNKITTQSDTSSMKIASPRKDNDNSVSGMWIFFNFNL